jgi:hypothetical protein
VHEHLLRTHTHTATHTHIHTYTRTHARAHTHTHSHERARTRTHAQTHAQTQQHTDTKTRTHTRTHTHTHARTNSQHQLPGPHTRTRKAARMRRPGGTRAPAAACWAWHARAGPVGLTTGLARLGASGACRRVTPTTSAYAAAARGPSQTSRRPGTVPPTVPHARPADGTPAAPGHTGTAPARPCEQPAVSRAGVSSRGARTASLSGASVSAAWSVEPPICQEPLRRRPRAGRSSARPRRGSTPHLERNTRRASHTPRTTRAPHLLVSGLQAAPALDVQAHRRLRSAPPGQSEPSCAVPTPRAQGGGT